MDNGKWTSFIEELKSRNDIVDVMSSYITVTPKGRSYWANCPFHHEKTPSMSINKDGQFYKCFGCGVSGDVIKFVTEYNSCSFSEAVEILAKRSGMKIPEFAPNKDEQLIDKERKQKQLCYDICLLTARYYYNSLSSSLGKQASNYLIKRGISKQTAVKFGIGVSPDWDGLPKFLADNKIDMPSAKLAGVVDFSKSGKPIDSLATRLIIPIIDSQNRVIAFGGRTLDAKPTFAKYKNTSQTAIFDKSKSLFGINLVKKIKQTSKLDSIIIVEGYMDTIALVQAGYDNVVASMGTSLTVEQAKAIKRLVDVVYICYDGDSAGQKATIRGLDILHSQSLAVKVMSLPNNLDPDEVVLQQGREAFDKLMEQALPLTDYKLKVLKLTHAIDSKQGVAKQEAIRKYASDALRVINELSDNVAKESYITLLSKQTNFSMDFLKSQVVKVVDDNFIIVAPVEVKVDKAEYFIVASMLFNKPYATEQAELNCNDNVIVQALKYIGQCKDSNKQCSPSMMYQLISDSEEIKRLEVLLSTSFSTNAEDDKYYQGCINSIKRKKLMEQIDILTKQYNEETSNKAQLLLQLNQLQQQLRSRH